MLSCVICLKIIFNKEDILVNSLYDKKDAESVLNLKDRFILQRENRLKNISDKEEKLDEYKNLLKELEEKAKYSEKILQRAAKGKATRIRNLEKAISEFNMKSENETTEEDRKKYYKNYIEYTRKTAPNYKSKRKRSKKSHAYILEETKRQIKEAEENIKLHEEQIQRLNLEISRDEKIIETLNIAFVRVTFGESWKEIRQEILGSKKEVIKKELNKKEDTKKEDNKKESKESDKKKSIKKPQSLAVRFEEKHPKIAKIPFIGKIISKIANSRNYTTKKIRAKHFNSKKSIIKSLTRRKRIKFVKRMRTIPIEDFNKKTKFEFDHKMNNYKARENENTDFEFDSANEKKQEEKEPEFYW